MSAAGDTSPTALTARSDLSRIRHDLRTPINHIIGYCEMLQEDEGTPVVFHAELVKIHGGGRRLLTLINEYFSEANFQTRQHDLQQLCHELRTPVNHIIGYGEMLRESAQDAGAEQVLPDLEKIIRAAHTWLALMEQHLLPKDDAPAPAAARPREIPAEAAPASRALPPLSGNLLVVDDDEGNRDMLARRLQRQGCAVTAASNGAEALELLAARPFDLVLLDMLMPGLDGFEVLTRMKAAPALVSIPVIMISALDQDQNIVRCIEAGADDYVAKPFNPVFLRARIGACLEKKRLRDQERQTYEALLASQKKLAAELDDASRYVQSLLPAPIEEGPVRAAWRFLPSEQLGGDAFGYHWLDERRFAVYLLDVCGHGVGAALLSVSVMNVLTNRALPVDYAEPGAVLAALNNTFSMEKQNNMYFTIWYGVIDVVARELLFACGGHPPAALLGADGNPVPLRVPGAIIGGFPEAVFRTGRQAVPPGGTIHVFSDGVYELERPDGSTVQLEEFFQELSRPCQGSRLERIVQWARTIRAGARFDDDVSLIELHVP
jgi:sigma-B regulation protein RsbU (phosphoserine phosphatase)